jgi:hypothetical protein
MSRIDEDITEPGHKMCLRDVSDDIQIELSQACQEFADFASPHEGYAIILEELDELWDEVRLKTGTAASRYKEAKQTAAMAIRFMLTFGDGSSG